MIDNLEQRPNLENKEEQFVVDLVSLVEKNNFDAKDMEEAYLAAMGKKELDGELAQMTKIMTQALDEGFPANKIAEMIAQKREFDNEKEEIQEKLYKLNFDTDSIAVLKQMIFEQKEGEYIIKVNNANAFQISIKHDAHKTAPQIMAEVDPIFTKLEQMGNNFKLQAEFFEKE